MGMETHLQNCFYATRAVLCPELEQYKLSGFCSDMARQQNVFIIQTKTGTKTNKDRDKDKQRQGQRQTKYRQAVVFCWYMARQGYRALCSHNSNSQSPAAPNKISSITLKGQTQYTNTLHKTETVPISCKSEYVPTEMVGSMCVWHPIQVSWHNKQTDKVQGYGIWFHL